MRSNCSWLNSRSVWSDLSPLSHSAVLRSDSIDSIVSLSQCSLHELGCPVLVRMGDREQHFFISGEDATSDGWANFYSADPFSNPKLDAILKPLGLNWDWESPGCMVVFND